MINSLNFKNAFISIFQDSSWKKNLLFGGLFQLVLILSVFLISKEQTFILGLFLLFFVFMYLLGYGLNTIKASLKINAFVFSSWNLKDNLKSGLKLFLAIIVFLLVLYLSIIIVGLISTILVLIFIILFANKTTTNEALGWIGVIITAFIYNYIIYPYLIITFPAVCKNYIEEDKISAFLAFRKSFKVFKNNWKNSLKMAVMLLLLPLIIIPFIGFYIQMVWADLFAQYTRIVNENKLEIE